MTNERKLQVRRDRYAMSAALAEAGVQSFRGLKCKCPFHDDKQASADIFQTKDDSVWRFKCHVCGFKAADVFDVLARARKQTVDDVLKAYEPDPDRPNRPSDPPPQAAKMPVEEVRKPTVHTTRESLSRAVVWAASGGQGGRIERTHQYVDAAGGRVFLVFRVLPVQGGKQFIQARWDEQQGGYLLRRPEGLLPLYRLPRVLGAKTVFVVEGEKAADCGNEVFRDDATVAFTTSSGGAGKGEFTDWSPLAGKTVILWPDNDSPDPKTGKTAGIEHMNAVADILNKMNAGGDTTGMAVSLVDPKDLNLPPKGDCVEFVEEWNQAGTSEADLRLAFMSVADGAEPVGAGRVLSAHLRDLRTGRVQYIPWKPKLVTALTRASLNGTVTTFCGDAGSTKSFFFIENHAFWYERQVPNAIFMLEDDAQTHLLRAMAQREELEQLTDADWHLRNPQRSLDIENKHRRFFDGFAKCVHTSPDDMLSLDQLAEWTYERCHKDKCRIVTIDPVTAALTGSKPWIDDLKFIMRVKTICRQTGASINLVTHPRKGTGKGGAAFSMHDLAGGAAYQRFAHTVLWLTRHDDPKRVVLAPAGVGGAVDRMSEFEGLIDREMVILKARNAKGAGARVGFQFEQQSLKFREMGIIRRDAKKSSDDASGDVMASM